MDNKVQQLLARFNNDRTRMKNEFQNLLQHSDLTLQREISSLLSNYSNNNKKLQQSYDNKYNELIISLIDNILLCKVPTTELDIQENTTNHEINIKNPIKKNKKIFSDKSKNRKSIKDLFKTNISLPSFSTPINHVVPLHLAVDILNILDQHFQITDDLIKNGFISQEQLQKPQNAQQVLTSLSKCNEKYKNIINDILFQHNKMPKLSGQTKLNTKNINLSFPKNLIKKELLRAKNIKEKNNISSPTNTAAAALYKLSTSIIKKEEIPQYKCPQKGCNKSFFKKIELFNHQSIHLKSKPFSCKYCNKQFQTSELIKKHIKNKHNDKSLLFRSKRFSHLGKVSKKNNFGMIHINEKTPKYHDDSDIDKAKSKSVKVDKSTTQQGHMPSLEVE